MASTKIERVHWLRRALGDGRTNASILLDFVRQFPDVDEEQGFEELKELLEKIADRETLPQAPTRAKYLEIGWNMLSECRAVGQFGPAVTLYKTLIGISGAHLDDSVNRAPLIAQGAAGVPDASVVRERIRLLLQDAALKAEAISLGLNPDPQPPKAT